MGGLAEWQIARAIKALTTRDSGLARRVIAADASIDVMQRNIEQRAVETIVRRQPVAGDLRQIIAILRIANEIERTGDLAKNISKRVTAIKGENTPLRPIRDISHMATLMLTQLRDVLDSFARRDVSMALVVWSQDQEIDELCTVLFRELLVHDGRLHHNVARNPFIILHKESRTHGRSCDQYSRSHPLHGQRRDADRATKS
jgi:phosphate transport system protein